MGLKWLMIIVRKEEVSFRCHVGPCLRVHCKASDWIIMKSFGDWAVRALTGSLGEQPASF